MARRDKNKKARKPGLAADAASVASLKNNVIGVWEARHQDYPHGLYRSGDSFTVRAENGIFNLSNHLSGIFSIGPASNERWQEYQGEIEAEAPSASETIPTGFTSVAVEKPETRWWKRAWNWLTEPVQKKTEDNLTEDPFAPYKGTGTWITAYFFSAKPLTLSAWNTQMGNIHFNSALDFDRIKTPFWLGWQKKHRFVKAIFTVGREPYPDLNPPIVEPNYTRRKIALMAKSACIRSLRPVMAGDGLSLPRPLFTRVTTTTRKRYWGESYKQYWTRVYGPAFTREAIADSLIERIRQWRDSKNRKPKTTFQTSYVDVGGWSTWAEELEL